MTKTEFIKRWGIREGMHVQIAVDEMKMCRDSTETHSFFGIAIDSRRVFYQYGNVLEINETDIVLLHETSYKDDKEQIFIIPLDAVIKVSRSVTDEDRNKLKEIQRFADKMNKMTNG